MRIPSLKKTISSFLLSERGSIKKSSLLKLGIYCFGMFSVIDNVAASCDHNQSYFNPDGEPGSGHGQAHCNTGCIHENCDDSPVDVYCELNIKCESIGDYKLIGDGGHANIPKDDTHLNVDPNCGAHENDSFGAPQTETAECYGHKNSLTLTSSGDEIVANHSHDIKDISVSVRVSGEDGHVNECADEASVTCHASRAGASHSNGAGHSNAGGHSSNGGEE